MALCKWKGMGVGDGAEITEQTLDSTSLEGSAVYAFFAQLSCPLDLLDNRDHWSRSHTPMETIERSKEKNPELKQILHAGKWKVYKPSGERTFGVRSKL